MNRLLFILYLIFTAQLSHAVTTTWTGNIDIWWNTAGNWSNGIPSSSDNVIIPDVSGASGNNPLFTNTSSNIACMDLTINSGAILTLSSTTNKSIYVYGDIVVNGTITGSHAKLVLYGSGAKSISGTPIDVTSVFLFSRNGSDYTLNSSWTIYNLQTQDANSTFNIADGITLTTNHVWNRTNCYINLLGSGVLDVNGNDSGSCGVAPVSGSTFSMNLGTLHCYDDLPGHASATFNAGTGTVVLDGGAQNVYAWNFYNLEIGGTGDKTLSGNTTVSNQLTFSANQDFVTNGHTLTITTTPSGYSDDRLIKGGTSSTVSVEYQASSGTICFIPVGIDGSLRTIGIGPLSAETFTVVYTPGSPGTINWNTTPTGAPVESGGPVVHVNNHYYYDISRVGSVNANIYMGFLGLTPPSSTADMYIMHWNSSSNQWERLTNYILRTASLVAATATSFSPFTQGSGGGALPIDLVSFAGKCENNFTELEFVVASQINNDYYTIERSVDGNEWSEIGLIEGEGSTSTQMMYKWTDENPFNGVSYYRLTQTDYDGTSEIFDPIVVSCETSVKGYSVYPNPANEVLNIDLELENYQGNDIEIEIMDINGRIVQSQSTDLHRGFNHLEVDISEFPSGVYMINFSGTKNYIKESRIVKQ